MSLTPFTDLLAYAKGEGDLPQRFYSTPEYERLADWRLLAEGVELPVHSQILCQKSKVYLGMATEGLQPTAPLALPDCSLGAALAFLRIAYDNEVMSVPKIVFMDANDTLRDVLRLCDVLDTPIIKTPLAEGRASWPPLKSKTTTI